MAESNIITYQALKIKIAQDRLQRVQEHQKKIADLKAGGLLDTANPDRPLILLADGDSWFDYFPDLPEFLKTDIIHQLTSLPAKSPTILNLAHWGDPSTESMGVIRQQNIIAKLTDPANGPFDAILYSGGGDDMVGDPFCLWINRYRQVGGDPSQAINQDRMDHVFGVIQAAYEDLIALRNLCPSPINSIPIFVHSYDLAYPTGKGTPCSGPWLKPSLDYRGWTDFNQATFIVQSMLKEFAARLDQLASDPANNMIHIHTQGTLASQSDWDNELHPTGDGFQKIAQERFVTSLRAQFPNRI